MKTLIDSIIDQVKSVSLVLLFLLFGVAKLSAVETTISATNGTNIVFTGPAHISSIAVQSATANILKFYDNSTNSTTYTNALYTNYVSYATNFTVKWTNSYGFVWTNYFSGNFTQPVSVPANTNNLPVAITLLPSAGVAQITPVDLIVAKGFIVTATNNATITVTYR